MTAPEPVRSDGRENMSADLAQTTPGVLDLPDVVEADAISELDLLEGVLEQPVLGTLARQGRGFWCS
jgi:hypothetical protein